MKFCEIFWDDVKNDALNRAGGFKQKGNDYTIFSPSKSLSNKLL